MKKKYCCYNIINDFKNIIECKKTDATTWNEKEAAWQKVTQIFNSKSPNLCPRSKESLKKFYDNKKKEVRKIVAEERIERMRTGGGKNPVLYEDPVKEIALSVMNSKTVVGLPNKYDGDNIFKPTTSSSTSTDSYIQFNEDLSVKLLDNNAPYELIESATIQESNELDSGTVNIECGETNVCIMTNQQQINWGDYKPAHLKTPLHNKLSSKISTEKNQGKDSDQNQWIKRRRPTSVALHSSNLTKNYTDLASVKLELATLQLEAFKADTASRQEREDIEFDLKKKILETELLIKKQTLKSLQSLPP